MKRSTMCEIINAYMTGPRHNATASTLLQVIEDAGMLPPIEPDRRVEDLDLGVPRWEPEDEETDETQNTGEATTE